MNGEETFLNEETVFEPEPREAIALDRKRQENKMKIILKILRSMHRHLEEVIELLDSTKTFNFDDQSFVESSPADLFKDDQPEMIEGVFNGEAMVGADGQIYHIPENYASKSKLVEGDLLKLSIRSDGSFCYKQISPIKRERRTGLLHFDQASNHFVVLCENTFYRILGACVTYYGAQIGDQVVILVPQGEPCAWAAVEHILKT
jgi:hypothetical protein